MSQPLKVFQPQKDQILCLQEIEDIEHISQKISLQTPQQTLILNCNIHINIKTTYFLNTAFVKNNENR